MEIKGNKFLVWLGNILVKQGNKLIKKGEILNITEYTANLVDPFILITKFNINGEKYHIVTQGQYKEKYKEFQTDNLPLNDNEFFEIINSQKAKWVKRK